MTDSTFTHAFLGSLQADALAMPVHWYYDREALHRDYGPVDRYKLPRNPHPDSILWRSSYQPVNESGNILHHHAEYWGKRGIHYHQFLQAGENTLNFQLARELVRWGEERGGYDPDEWLKRYVDVMRTPGWHRDTCVEEVHRGFFTHVSNGKVLRKCAIRDEHIGGLSQVPALCHLLQDEDLPSLRQMVKLHVGLTHAHPNVLRAADTLVRVMWALREEGNLSAAIRAHAGDWISLSNAERWKRQPDTHIVGRRFSPACYIDQAMPASLYLAWKYADSYTQALQANAEVGGDNCHRGAVVGALAGMLHPEQVNHDPFGAQSVACPHSV